jgi:hypothetical protein
MSAARTFEEFHDTVEAAAPQFDDRRVRPLKPLANFARLP